jgi:hypothetical protein
MKPGYEEAGGFNNNMHEMSITGDGPWEGKKPNIPPQSWFDDPDASDYSSGLASQYRLEGEI